MKNNFREIKECFHKDKSDENVTFVLMGDSRIRNQYEYFQAILGGQVTTWGEKPHHSLQSNFSEYNFKLVFLWGPQMETGKQLSFINSKQACFAHRIYIVQLYQMQCSQWFFSNNLTFVGVNKLFKFFKDCAFKFYKNNHKNICYAKNQKADIIDFYIRSMADMRCRFAVKINEIFVICLYFSGGQMKCCSFYRNLFFIDGIYFPIFILLIMNLC